MKLKFLVLLCLIPLLSACSVDDVFPEKRVDYKKADRSRSLEVPPDLTKPNRDDTMAVPDVSPASGSATYSAYSSERQGRPAARGAAVLPKQDKARVERDGDRYWLVVDAEPSQVWPAIREFWLEQGFLLKIDNPAIGILETSWAENRADIPQGPIRKVLGGALGSFYSAATRDKYRIRVERGTEPGTTEIYITHRGVEEVLLGDATATEGTAWKRRPRDPELEVEMLKRLMVFIGVQDERAKRQIATTKDQAPPKAHMTRTGDGSVSLVLRQSFSQAWRSTGLALDRIGFNVQDRDRSRGIYYVRYADPTRAGGDEGFLSKLAFWDDGEEEASDQYQVFLKKEGKVTRVLVLNDKGETDTSGTAERILKLLHEQLR